MTIVMGIDPGPRYAAVSVLDINSITGDETILYSGTFKRKDETLPVTWAYEVVQKVREVTNQYRPDQIGIENVEPPKSHFQGKKNFLNPKHLIFLALVVGGLAVDNPHAVLVRPGKNGSGTSYPPELTGHRPKTLPGEIAGTRNHERSAYDVAKQTPRLYRENYVLDTQKGIFDE